MAKKHWTAVGRQRELDELLRQVATGRLSRRRFAQRALALGVSATAVASALRGGGVLARQEATPEGFVPIGEQLDLANLSPEIPDPTEPVTITFASWVNESEAMVAFRDQFQELHPNITVEFQGIPAEEMTDRLTTQIAGGNPPDTAFIDQSAVVDFASRNALVDLRPCFKTPLAVA